LTVKMIAKLCMFVIGVSILSLNIPDCDGACVEVKLLNFKNVYNTIQNSRSNFDVECCDGENLSGHDNETDGDCRNRQDHLPRRVMGYYPCDHTFRVTFDGEIGSDVQSKNFGWSGEISNEMNVTFGDNFGDDNIANYFRICGSDGLTIQSIRGVRRLPLVRLRVYVVDVDPVHNPNDFVAHMEARIDPLRFRRSGILCMHTAWRRHPTAFPNTCEQDPYSMQVSVITTNLNDEERALTWVWNKRDGYCSTVGTRGALGVNRCTELSGGTRRPRRRQGRAAAAAPPSQPALP